MEKTIAKKDIALELISRLEKTSEYAEETFVKNFNKSEIIGPESKEFIQEIEYMRKCMSNYFYSLGATDKYTNKQAMELWYGRSIGLSENTKQFGELFGTWCKNPICIEVNGFEINKFFDIMFGTHNSKYIYDKISKESDSDIEYCSQGEYISWMYDEIAYEEDEEEAIEATEQEAKEIEDNYPRDYDYWHTEHGTVDLVILQNKTFSDFCNVCKDEKQIKIALGMIKSFTQTVYPYNYAVIPTVVKGKDLKELGVNGIEVDNAVAILTECSGDVWYDSYSDRNMSRLLCALRNYILLKQLDITMQNIIDNKNI